MKEVAGEAGFYIQKIFQFRRIEWSGKIAAQVLEK
jgi:hypothetical protein